MLCHFWHIPGWLALIFDGTTHFFGCGSQSRNGTVVIIFKVSAPLSTLKYNRPSLNAYSFASCSSGCELPGK